MWFTLFQLSIVMKRNWNYLAVSLYYIRHLQYILLLSDQLHLCVITKDKRPWKVILLSTSRKIKINIIIISLQEGFLGLHWDWLATIITGILTKPTQLYILLEALITSLFVVLLALSMDVLLFYKWINHLCPSTIRFFISLLFFFFGQVM